MIKIEHMKWSTIYVVFFGGVLVAGCATTSVPSDTASIDTEYVETDYIQAAIDDNEDIDILVEDEGEDIDDDYSDRTVDSIIDGTQQRIAKLAEKLQRYQIQAEREKKLAEAIARAAHSRVEQTRLEMVRAQQLLEQLLYRQGASLNIGQDKSVDDIVNETQKQVVRLTVKLQQVQIQAERDKKKAEARVKKVQLEIEQLIEEKRRVQELMNQLSPASYSGVATVHPIVAARRPASWRQPQALRQGYMGQQVVVLDDVLFDKNEAVLKYSAMPTINMVANFLLRNPQRKALITGHTDYKGKEGYNLSLSERRAKSVFYALLEKGVPLKKLRVAGYGESRPKYAGKSEMDLMQNRRVEITIMN